ncbi:TraY domain-containing protein [Pelosinus propionicus]|uniref:Arc-like DNA binding domain-containing protein n=1 Tax=Pelosinus propionicus DSM 13327 TaxID=1123291 RepID=A0A1I4PTP3_9FIRM|nr:TraY domain-containing protein [Pelosinus propionicus]SFM30843.1 hypothetical protein SAMN04490355_10728 [Pelosinus propionicus DSM 13327]
MSILRYTLRIEDETLEKLRYIADDNFRTVNKELEKIIKIHIAQYEERNGKIEVIPK